MFQDFQERLQDGETILWTGQPVPLVYALVKTAWQFPLLCVFLPLIWWLGKMHYHTTSSPILDAAFVVIALLVTPPLAYHVTKNEAKTAGYALTNRRVLLRLRQTQGSRLQPFRYEIISLANVKPKLSERRDGIGTITLGFSVFEYDKAFRSIAAPRAVYEMLLKAQAALPPSASPSAYYVSPAPVEISSFSLDAILWQEETVLWKGRPDARLFVRRRAPLSVTLSAVLFTLLVAVVLVLGFSIISIWLLVGLLPSTALALLIVPPFLRREATAKTYFITTKRLLIVSERRGKTNVTERDLARLPMPKIKRYGDGTGTLTFENARVISMGTHAAVEGEDFIFQQIPQVEETAMIVAEAKHVEHLRKRTPA